MYFLDIEAFGSASVFTMWCDVMMMGLPLVLLLGSFGPTIRAILCWTTYSCQNKRQNALFWARKLKKILGRGHSPLPWPHPYWGGDTPSPPNVGACGASPHICQPPVIFSQFSHWLSTFFTVLSPATFVDSTTRPRLQPLFKSESCSSWTSSALT